jgi:hypothetical protein
MGKTLPHIMETQETRRERKRCGHFTLKKRDKVKKVPQREAQKPLPGPVLSKPI